MSQSADPPFVLAPGEGRPIDLGNFAMTVKMHGESTGAGFSLLEADEPPGFGPPVHIHHDTSEAFYVLSGEYIVHVEDQEFRCPTGTFIYVPPGVRHGFRVGASPSRKLNLFAPAAMIGYFDELSAAIAADEADPAQLEKIAVRYGVEIVGPVPEGYL